MEAQEAIRTAYRTTMQTHRKSKGRERSISQIPHTSAVHTTRTTHHLQRIRVYPCQIKKSLTPQNITAMTTDLWIVLLIFSMVVNYVSGIYVGRHWDEWGNE